MAETKGHHIRIPDSEWDEAVELAVENGEYVTDMIRRGLRREIAIARAAKAQKTRLYHYKSSPHQQSIVVSLTDEQARQRMRPGVTLEPL